MDSEIIRRIKTATVAIGVKNMTDAQIWLMGTGFIYDKRGYIISAQHVLQGCQEYDHQLFHQGKSSEVVIHRVSYIEKDHWRFEINVLDEFISIMTDPTQKFLTSPKTIDVGLAKIQTPTEEYPTLEMANPDKLCVGDEIIMCGYPMTPLTFSFKRDEYSGMRFSPIMQFGHISTLMPFDEIDHPYGLQTDIVGTGGSSGSPLLNIGGEVVGLAQNVLPTHTEVIIPNNMRSRFKKHEKLTGSAQIGLVGGDTCYRMLPIPTVTKDGFESAAGKMTQSPTSDLFVGEKPSEQN